MYPVPTYKTVDQSVQIYNEPGDGTNWHHDRSIFNGGRAFTFLFVIYNTSDQQLTVWTEQHGIEKIQWSVGKAVLIEKFKTYHSVTPLGHGERILVALTYSEIPYYPSIERPIEYVMNKAKNYGYLGLDAFDIIDYILLFIIFVIVCLSIYFAIQKLMATKRKIIRSKRRITFNKKR